MKTELFIRDKSKKVTLPIHDFDSFDAIIRRRNVGSWSIKMQAGEKAFLLQRAGYGIVAERDGEEIFAGSMTQDEPQWSKDSDKVILSGLSDDQQLWDQIAYPSTPNWSDPAYKVFAADAYDVDDGVAETVIKGFVTRNFAASDRRAPGAAAPTVAADEGRGEYVIGRGRFQYLGDLLTELATSNGNDLGFFLRSGVFDVYEPRDLRRAQVFSRESGNLESSKGKRTAPTATDVITAGGGEQEDRVFVRSRDTDREEEWARHIERFQDARDTTDPVELAQRGEKTLLEGAEMSAVDIQAIDRPNREYGKNWRVGDYVTIGEIDAVVREARLTLDQDGETVTPTIDNVTTITARDILKLFDAVRDLRRQVNYLQRTR